MEAEQLSGGAFGVEGAEGGVTGGEKIGDEAGDGGFADAAFFAVRQDEAGFGDGSGLGFFNGGSSAHYDYRSSIREKGCTFGLGRMALPVDWRSSFRRAESGNRAASWMV